MNTILQDLRYGTRMLLKKPGFTLIAIATLALGIGANTAIFSVVNAVVLRPLPYEEPDQLVFLNERHQQLDEMSISWPNYSDWRAQSQVFEKIGVYNRSSYNLTESGEPERLLAGQVSADLFAALRVQAALGRVFTNEEDKPGGEPVVVLSHALWQRRFGGDSNIINRTIKLNDRAYTVLGVMPNGYRFPSRVEMWVSAGQLSGSTSWQSRGNHPGLYGVARLNPGVSIEQARADMESIAIALEKENPNTNQGNRVAIASLKSVVVDDTTGKALWVLLSAVGFVLLIACANVANLLLARASTRQREMAVRVALGASRWRIMRQLLTESILLAVTGGGLGVLLSQWGVELILAISPDSIPRSAEISLDKGVLVFTAAVSVFTGIVFGLAPAFQASRVQLHDALKESGRSLVAGRHWARSVLVVAETALTLVLLVGAGLLIRSFYQLQQVNAGFNSERLLSFSVSLPEQKYKSIDQRLNFFQELMQRLKTTPGVEAVSVSSGLPLGNNGWQTSFTVTGRPRPAPGETPLMEACVVSPDYFRTMGISLIRGRSFTDQDNREHLKGRDLSSVDEDRQLVAGVNAVVIDEEFARRFWPDEDPLGKQLHWGGGADPSSPKMTIVGVVGRVKMDALNLDTNRVQGYFCFYQMPFSGMVVTAKTRIDPLEAVSAARTQVQQLDASQPIYDVKTMERIRSESVASQRLNLALLGTFAGLALLLAVVGIYGVMSYSVTQRTHEIGIRVALGAQRRDVLKMVVGQGLTLAATGVGIGLVMAYWLTALMKDLLYEVQADDPVTFTVIAALLIVVAFLACWLPARRATRVDPMVALRYE